MSMIVQQPRRRAYAACKVVACVLAAVMAFSATAAADDGEELVANDVGTAFVAHGSDFGKSETVAVKTDLSGRLDSLSVEEWIKNPQGLDEIADVSNLQNIVAKDDEVTFEQDGEAIVWHAGGKDVVYTGTSARELPFSIAYEYFLDGVPVDPGALKGATGRLDVHITYGNLTNGTIETAWGCYDIQDPFVMASVISFDAEHAQNVSVDNGSVIDQQGTLMAVGVGMPGLGRTLDVEDLVDLPVEVTISADVRGFDMPDITTIVTSQVFSAVDAGTTGDMQAQLDDAIGQLGGIADAIGALSEGNAKLAEATGKISEGSAAMAENLPNATDGLQQLADVATAASGLLSAAAESQQGIAQNEQASVELQQAALGSVDEAATGVQEAVEALPAEAPSLEDALAEQQAALEALKAIDTSGMGEEEKAALEAAIADIEASIAQTQDAAAAVDESAAAVEGAREKLAASGESLAGSSESLQASLQALGGNDDLMQALAQDLATATQQTGGLSQGLTGAVDGFGKVQEGMAGLSAGLEQVSAANGKLSQGASQMSDGVSEAIGTVQGNIDSKVDLVNALRDYVENQPAYGGSRPDMPATTMYVVHAKSELTPLRETALP